jgi:hypothetical protein
VANGAELYYYVLLLLLLLSKSNCRSSRLSSDSSCRRYHRLRAMRRRQTESQPLNMWMQDNVFKDAMLV